MNFGEALAELKDGKKVSREGWNGKGMWLSLVKGDQWGLGSDTHFDKVSVEFGDKLPWIGMKTVDNKFVPWLASQTDVLAEDWGVVE